MKPITFCIASANNEKLYTLSLLDSLKQHTEFNKHEFLIFIDSDNENTYEALDRYRKDKPNIKIYRNTSGYAIGSQRNVSIMFAQATKEIVVYLQSDMVVCPDFDKYFLEALDNNKNRVISAARIEPPLHPASPEKIVKDYGLHPNEFKHDEFYQFTKELQKENRPLMDGHFAPFGCFKDTYFNIMGGFDTRFRNSREDSDFIIRLKANNVETYQSWNACVYHYTCVSSRGVDWYKNDQDAEIKNAWQSKADEQELKRFIRKWGYFGHYYKSKYQTELFIDINTAPNIALLLSVEPFFDTIVLNDEPLTNTLINRLVFENYYYNNKRFNFPSDHWEKVRKHFIDPRLEDKIKYSPNPTLDRNPEIIYVTTDMHKFNKAINNKDVQGFIQSKNNMFSELSKQSDPTGRYEIECFSVEVNKLKDSNLQHLNNKQYLIDTTEFIFK